MLFANFFIILCIIDPIRVPHSTFIYKLDTEIFLKCIEKIFIYIEE